MKTAIAPQRTNGGLNTAHEDFMRQLLNTLGDLSDGDFSVRLPSDLLGLEGRVADRGGLDRPFAEVMRIEEAP